MFKMTTDAAALTLTLSQRERGFELPLPLGEGRGEGFRTLVASLVAAITLFLALATVGLAAEGKGTIKGSLANGTAGGGSLSGLEVTLTAYSGSKESGQKTARSDQEGKFLFEGLDTGPDFTYQLSLRYQDAPYYSEPIALPADSTGQAVEMQLFDATADASVVKSSARHYLLDADADGVFVSEIVILKNSSDRTFVGSQEAHPGVRETFRFSVPEGAQNVELGDGLLGSQVFPVEGGFADTTPVYPGDSQRIFRYQIPAKGGSASFAAKLSLPTEKVSALIRDSGVEVSVTNLPNRSSPTIQGDKFLLFGGQNLAANTALEFKLDRLPRAQQPAGPIGALPLLVGAAALLAVVAAAVVLRRRRALGPEALEPEEQAGEEEYDLEPDGEQETEALQDEKEELVAAIVRLDDRFEQGKIGSEEYGRLREQKKRRLVQVVSRQRALVGSKGER